VRASGISFDVCVRQGYVVGFAIAVDVKFKMWESSHRDLPVTRGSGMTASLLLTVTEGESTGEDEEWAMRSTGNCRVATVQRLCAELGL
jgi:hypothetical protein